MLSLTLLAIGAYVATNIDNLFVLLAFLAEAGSRRRHVIAGQCIGSLGLVIGSALLAAVLTHLPAGYVGLLGFLPVGLGLVKLGQRFGNGRVERRQHEPAQSSIDPPLPPFPKTGSTSWTVVAVALANGSDNLAVYVPLYAGHSHTEGALISLTFVVMIGLWCAGAVWLVKHPLLGAPIRRYGEALLPLILLTIGVSVIAQNDTLRIVFGL
ncbi:cadmium resistance transporter [Paraburkholderia sp. BCC1886]|uniref:cadmium resistance transporter n=1 Tax=Paraburkholderia sp. BCC1886 TaxID=2562670 RepID=UPI00118426FB|nr:cadmium resistance transporter [Paraburkholderia sp. BCC1886]